MKRWHADELQGDTGAYYDLILLVPATLSDIVCRAGAVRSNWGVSVKGGNENHIRVTTQPPTRRGVRFDQI